MKNMGTKSEQYDVPVYNSFKSKIRKDQLCYEIDLEDYKDPNNIEKQLKAFRSGKREHEMMSLVARNLTDQQISDLAAWYQSIEIKAKMPE